MVVNNCYSHISRPGHPQTRLLIYHGGINGVYEALYHKVPMVLLPIFADQPAMGGSGHQERHGRGLGQGQVDPRYCQECHRRSHQQSKVRTGFYEKHKLRGSIFRTEILRQIGQISLHCFSLQCLYFHLLRGQEPMTE